MEPSHDNLYSKTQLRKMGLIPVGEPVKRVKGEWGWFDLYRPDETKSIRKASATQCAALEKARAAKVQKEKERREEERLRVLEGERAWHEALREDRNDAILWARRRLECADDFVILDVETTGLESPLQNPRDNLLERQRLTRFLRLAEGSRDRSPRPKLSSDLLSLVVLLHLSVLVPA